MGTGMVTNLLRSGHEVTVWNRTPSKVSHITAYNTSMLTMSVLLVSELLVRGRLASEQSEGSSGAVRHRLLMCGRHCSPQRCKNPLVSKLSSFLEFRFPSFLLQLPDPSFIRPPSYLFDREAPCVTSDL